MFRDSRMVAVCQYNAMPGEDVVLLRHYLRKHNIEVKFVLNEVGLGAEAGGVSPVPPPCRVLRAASRRSCAPCCPSPATGTSSRSSWGATSCW